MITDKRNVYETMINHRDNIVNNDKIESWKRKKVKILEMLYSIDQNIKFDQISVLDDLDMTWHFCYVCTNKFEIFLKKILSNVFKVKVAFDKIVLINFRHCFAISRISHLNSICIHWVKYTNENSFWNSKWILFK